MHTSELVQPTEPAVRRVLPGGLITMLALGTTIILWASAFVGIRAALPAYGPLHLAVLRFLVAAMVLGAGAFVLRVRLPERRDLPRIVLCGLLGITGYNLALNTGELEVSAGAASLLVNTGPIWTALLAQLLLKERLRPAGWIGIGLGFAGAATIALGAGSEFGVSCGALLVLLAAVQLSLYSVVQKPLLARYRPVEATTYAIFAGTLGLLPFGWGLPATILAAPLPATMAVIFLGIGPAALAYVAWAAVLARLPAGRAASFLYLVPPTVLVVAWLWLGELPGLAALGGGAIALGGVAIVARAGRRAELRPAAHKD
jgi:drug/metabolite transporter (DMT)-like permease